MLRNVKLVRTKDLTVILGKYDVYAKVMVGKKTIGKTKVAKKTANPTVSQFNSPTAACITKYFRANKYFNIVERVGFWSVSI